MTGITMEYNFQYHIEKANISAKIFLTSKLVEIKQILSEFCGKGGLAGP